MQNLSTIPRMQRMFFAALLFILMNSLSFAQSVWSGNGHTYDAVYAPGLTWAQAQAACEARGGYLATITSEEENDFIKSLFENNPAFWYIDGVNNALGPWIGGIQASGSSEPDGGWGWFNGEPFSYTDWSSHDPDNCCGLNQNRLMFIRDGNVPPTQWTDVEHFAGFVRGYIFESSPSTTTCVPAPSGLVSWWPGDDNANDIQSSNHGILQNGVTFTAGKVEQAFSFDGVDDALLVADNANLRVSSFTLDAWINTADAILIQPIIAKAQASGNWLSYMLRIQDGGKLALILENSAENRSVHWRTLSTLSSNRWYHVAGTWQNLNGDNTDAKIYVDGVEQAIEMSFNINGYSSTFLPGYTTEPLFIGRDEYPSGHFTGLIDEVDIYDRVLSAAEIQSLYNAGSAGKCTNTPPPVCVNPPSGLVSWWPGDGDANDIQGSNDGALQNGTTFGIGKVGQAFNFDGVDDRFEATDNPSLKPVNAITVDAWVYWRGPRANYNRILTKRRVTSAGGISYHLVIIGNKLFWGVNVSGSALGDAENVADPNNFSTNTWHHVVGTYDGTNLSLYVDGIQIASRAQSGSISYDTDPLVIGWYDSNLGEYFDGLIDEVEIFNRALSASEIQALYNAGSAGKCKECEPPEVSITGDDPVCPNTTHTYTANTDATNQTFAWSVTGGMIDGDNTGSSVSVTAGGAGTMTVSVEVTDGVTNCSNTATQNVTVEDTQAPVITAATNPITLWPPNHQYVTINVGQCVAAVTDNCATLLSSDVVIAKVTSDEPEDAKGGGDGNTKNDMVIAANCQSVQLRSEREGSGNGRVYTIHLSVNDGNGNTGAATCLVTIPKSQNGNPAIDDGPVYTVNGSCGSAAKFAGPDLTQATLPEGYALEQNYPNPFNPSTSIAFSVKESGVVQLTIYNLHGQQVRTLLNGQMNTGFHAVNWDGKDERGQVVPSGVYLYKLRVNSFTQTRKMTFMK